MLPGTHFSPIPFSPSQDKLTGAVAYSALALLASRAYQMYSAALFRKTAIERQIQKVWIRTSGLRTQDPNVGLHADRQLHMAGCLNLMDT